MDSSNLETGDEQLDNDVMEQVLPPGPPTGGREPPDAKSLRYAENEPPPHSTAFLKSWFLCLMKNFERYYLLKNVMI